MEPHIERDGALRRFQLPFVAYEPQRELINAIRRTLFEHRVPTSNADRTANCRFVAAELPTGCGKTAALLSSVLEFSSHLQQLSTAKDVADFFCVRCGCSLCKRHERNTKKDTKSRKAARSRENSDGDDESDADSFDAIANAAVLRFKKHLNASSHANRRSSKAVRLHETFASTSELRRHHSSPPCTVFYATRTHAQLKQCVHELRKFRDADGCSSAALKSNIVASRAHYCIHSRLRTMVAERGTSSVSERNQLGEMCDKMVELRQCEAVENFSTLAHKALTRPLHASISGTGGEKAQASSFAWDIEDLVHEGVSMRACPYYAARELVPYAGINFVTYAYLLDPIIRRESKIEAALHNHSVIVLDEGHNILSVSQDALSVSALSVRELKCLRREIAPLMGSHTVAADTAGADSEDTGDTMSVGFLPTYAKDFRSTKWSLTELFAFLDGEILVPLVSWCEAAATQHLAAPAARQTRTGGHPDADDDIVEGPMCRFSEAVTHAGSAHRPQLPRIIGRCTSIVDSDDWRTPFLEIYGILSSLGVTFNPFDLSVWAVGVLKRLLLVLRFALQHPASFAVWHSYAPPPSSPQPAPRDHEDDGNLRLSIRCLDGAIGFHHLSRAAYCIVVASGTLGPMPQLLHELQLPTRLTQVVETGHVVNASQQFRIGVVGQLHADEASSTCSPLVCTYRFFQDASALQQLAKSLLTIAVRPAAAVVHNGGGPSYGVLVFVPNFRVAEQLHSICEQLVRSDKMVADSHGDGNRGGFRRVRRLFVEPRQADKVSEVLDEHRRVIRQSPTGGVSVIIAVYRGKISEGIDFADDLGRLTICVGVPFRPVMSRTVEAQRTHNGSAWYVTDAVRAVNQAIGRCLRHADDFGAVVLMDQRYEVDASLSQQLPKWCRDRVMTWGSPAAAGDELERFFRPLLSQLRAPTRRPTSSSSQPATAVEVSLPPPSMSTSSVVAARALTPSLFSIPNRSVVIPPSCKPKTPPQELSLHRLYRSTALKLLCEASPHAEPCASLIDVQKATNVLLDAFPPLSTASSDIGEH